MPNFEDDLIQRYQQHEYLWIWFGEKADREEKWKWQTRRKLLLISRPEDSPVLEVKTTEELNNYEAVLRKHGWVVDDENTFSMHLNRLTCWTKPHSE